MKLENGVCSFDPRRIYDPEIGRFLSADLMIQFPESTLGLDRYTHVNNNPLSHTDLTGHAI